MDSLVFFGTGPVAAASLESLSNFFVVESVITKTPAPHIKVPAPVLEVASRLNLRTLFANSLAELDGICRLGAFKSSLGVIVDYGVIVSEQTIKSFHMGILNSHFSLLPEWRGADPITFTVLSGQSETGVSLMLIVPALDEGQLIAQEKIAVPAQITTPELTEILIDKSNSMLANYIPKYLNGDIRPYNQPDMPATYSRKLTKSDGIIDWSKPATTLEREVRAYAGWPKSRTILFNRDIVVTSTTIVDRAGPVGCVVEGNDNEIIVYCGQQAMRIDRLKPAGKNEMSAGDFLRGLKD